MFKFKNFKILLLLILFAFAGNNAWGGSYWYYSCIELRCTPSGAGKVYASTNQTKAQDPNNCVITTDGSDGEAYRASGRTAKSNRPYKWFVNTVPSNSQQYRFLKWVDQDGNEVSADQAPQKSFNDNECAEGLAPNDSKEDASGDPVDKYPTIIYTAVYEEIVNQYVSVESQDSGHLTATIDKPENQIGDIVTLWAYPNNYDIKFTGWYKDGELVSTENPWTFEIKQDNTGTYIATCETNYNFFRIRNKSTFRRFNAINNQGSISDFSALQLVSGDVATYSAGSVVEISTYHVSGGEVYDYTMQNAKTSSHYTVSEGKYMTMALNSGDNTWIIYPNRQMMFMADEGGSNVTAYGAKDDDIAHWYIDPMDKDLETCENYFSLDPAKLVQVGDKYYTTLRTSWNILYNPEQMTPYVVTSVDEETGTFEMEPITGNIIPAGTPVIIETNSNDVEENRMVPTTTAAASGAAPSDNKLVFSTKYFPNQSVSGNYKALMVNEEGQLAFGGDALTTVNGNEAYLQVANDVALKPIADLPTLATLKDIESTGEKGKLYTVEDGLVAVAFAVDEQKECALLWCKDQAESNAKTEMKTGQTDYMKNQYAKLYKSPAPEKWDQSNWVAVKLVPYKNVGLRDIATRLKNDVVGHVLKPKAVTGTYSDDVNYTIAMSMPEQDGKVIFENMIGDAFTYNENLYCTANFLSENLVGENGVTQSTTAEHYYFVNPKIQEVAKVTFAVWNGSYFVAPAPQEGTSTNESEINGAFNVDWRYNSYIINTLASNKAYQFMAVVQKPVAVAGGMGLKEESEVTPMDCTPDGTYMVFPLNLDPSNKDQVITSIAQLVVSKTVSRVVYYNLMGVASAVPFQGVNIVVSEYSDGSRKARKVVMK